MSAVLGGGGRQTRGEKRQGSTIDSARGFKRPLMSPHQTSELELVHKEKPEEEGGGISPCNAGVLDILARLSHCSSGGMNPHDGDSNFLCFNVCPSPALQVRPKTLSETLSGYSTIYRPNHLKPFRKMDNFKLKET